MNNLIRIFLTSWIVVVIGCATVRKQDLDAWVGMPVEALDTHSLFITLPMVRTITESGIEIRNYPNKRNIGSCFGSGRINTNTYLNYASYNSFAICSAGLVGCDNIFYIKNGVVVEYAPTGRCYTNETVQPQSRYYRLKEQ
ncbi:hypothetical protein MYX76_14830 [Desulfobacterota bacterium AH_259_B03_O07]|nr:hypothetical protein [Desulfobacterota bacterium AH_259_B03_O07]